MQTIDGPAGPIGEAIEELARLVPDAFEQLLVGFASTVSPHRPFDLHVHVRHSGGPVDCRVDVSSLGRGRATFMVKRDGDTLALLPVEYSS